MNKVPKLVKQSNHILVSEQGWLTLIAFGKITEESRNRVHFFTVCRTILANGEASKVCELIGSRIKIKIKAAYFFAIFIHFVTLHFFIPNRHIVYWFYLNV